MKSDPKRQYMKHVPASLLSRDELSAPDLTLYRSRGLLLDWFMRSTNCGLSQLADGVRPCQLCDGQLPFVFLLLAVIANSCLYSLEATF